MSHHLYVWNAAEQGPVYSKRIVIGHCSLGGRKRTVCSLQGIASGTLIARGYEWAGREWGRIDKYAFAVIIVAGATSYYGLYLSQVAVFQMVMYGVIDPLVNQLQTGQQIQYHAFLTSSPYHWDL